MKASLLLIAGLSAASPLSLAIRDSGLQTCNPSGTTSSALPKIGSDLSSLYTSLLSSVKGQSFSAKQTQNGDDGSDSGSFCCAQGTSCLTLADFSVPFCYDKFTTNYIFPDGSSGNIVAGNYNRTDGSWVNLLTGDYTADGTSGNIYSSNLADKPNTATLSVPPLYTASGVGSAIPINALGTIVVYTTTIPETTIQPTTIPASTVQALTVSGTTVTGSTTIIPTTIPATTVPATTVTKATTIPPHETVVTTVKPATTSASAASAAAAASASASEGGAAMFGPAPMVLFGAAAYVFAAL